MLLYARLQPTDRCIRKANDPATAALLSLIGVVVQGVDVPVGIGCSAISVIGVGSGNSCNAQTVCCKDNNVVRPFFGLHLGETEHSLANTLGRRCLHRLRPGHRLEAAFAMPPPRTCAHTSVGFLEHHIPIPMSCLLLQ